MPIKEINRNYEFAAEALNDEFDRVDRVATAFQKAIFRVKITHAPGNASGIRHVTFQVTDLAGTKIEDSFFVAVWLTNISTGALADLTPDLWEFRENSFFVEQGPGDASSPRYCCFSTDSKGRGVLHIKEASAKVYFARAVVLGIITTSTQMRFPT